MVRYYHLELLACPECGNTRLLVYALAEKEKTGPPEPSKVKCRRWCYLYDRPAATVPLKSCIRTCMMREIEEGLIVCTRCGRWYPIVDSIPVMMDDKYRDLDRDREFAERVRDALPDWVKRYTKIPLPFT